MKKTKILSVFLVLSLAALSCGTLTDLPQVTVVMQKTEVEEQTATSTPEDKTPITPQPTLSSSADPISGISGDLVNQQDAFIELYEKVSPGVVAIIVLTETGGGSGSGFVIDKEGHIVTNYHVVDGAQEIQVAFTEGIKTRAEVIGLDADSDLAIIEVDIPGEFLHPLPLGDSDQVEVGQLVIAIGNPFGLNGTMTTGIISSEGRTLESINESPSGQPFTAGAILQTDAAINPGNSGGPLLNLNGEVIGVNRAMRTYNTNANFEPVSSGIGFAISINIVKRVAPSLIAEGRYDYPYIGISSYSDIPLEEAERLGLEKTVGALLTTIVPGGPADKAGLRVDDVILQINDYVIQQYGDMVAYLFTHTSPGDIVQLIVLRNGEEIEVELELGARP